jgi:segregation and condensation protein B
VSRKKKQTKTRPEAGAERATALAPDTLRPPEGGEAEASADESSAPAAAWNVEATVDLTAGLFEAEGDEGEDEAGVDAGADPGVNADAGAGAVVDPGVNAGAGAGAGADPGVDADVGAGAAADMATDDDMDDDGDADTDSDGEPADPPPDIEPARDLSLDHLRGLLEALIFASDKPLKAGEVARLASAPVKQVRPLLAELKATYASRGIVLDEVAGGWLFRTNVQYAPFVRDLAAEKPVRLTRAQVETLAIAAYRQPITRPEIDDIRGVDSGATLKLLLERDLVRILGKKDEPGRPILYGTTTAFLALFGLRSLKDLPTLKEFTELSEDSRRVAEETLGAEALGAGALGEAASTETVIDEPAAGEGAADPQNLEETLRDGDPVNGDDGDNGHDTVTPPAPNTQDELEDPP